MILFVESPECCCHAYHFTIWFATEIAVGIDSTLGQNCRSFLGFQLMKTTSGDA